MLQNVDFFKTLLNGIKSKFQSQQKQISKHNTRLDDQQAQIEDLKNKKIDAVLYTPQTLTDEQQKQARDNIGADVGGYFEIRVTKSGDTYTADKTYNEIKVAVESGLTPVCRMKRWAADAILDDVFYYYNWQIVNNVPDANAFTFNNMSISVSRFIVIYNDGIVHYFDNMYNFYTLPTATSTTLGGVRPVAKTDVMTQDVGVDENGKLYTKPAEGGETWEVIADIITTSEDVLYYRYDVPDKKELIVLVSLTPLADSTSPVNGTIAINGTGNPWHGNYTNISGNILSVNSSERGGSVVLSGEIIDRKWVPKSLFSSLNRWASWNALRPDGTMHLTSDDTTNACSFTSVDAIRSVAVGSYTKWFGVGSHIYILAR